MCGFDDYSEQTPAQKRQSIKRDIKRQILAARRYAAKVLKEAATTASRQAKEIKQLEKQLASVK